MAHKGRFHLRAELGILEVVEGLVAGADRLLEERLLFPEVVKIALEPSLRRPLPEVHLAGGPRSALIQLAGALRGPRLPDLPPLTGGLMGVLSYEAATLLDGHPAPHQDDAPCPPIVLLVIDRAVVFDHWRQRLVLVAHASRGGYDAASETLAGLAQTVGGAAPLPIAHLDDAQTTVEGEPNMSDDRYRETVASFKEHILAGDIFQGVPSRRVSFPAPDGGFPIYRRLRVTNPAPYMFFLRASGIELAGSSPEPLVRVEGRRVSTPAILPDST